MPSARFPRVLGRGLYALLDLTCSSNARSMMTDEFCYVLTVNGTSPSLEAAFRKWGALNGCLNICVSSTGRDSAGAPTGITCDVWCSGDREGLKSRSRSFLFVFIPYPPSQLHNQATGFFCPTTPSPGTKDYPTRTIPITQAPEERKGLHAPSPTTTT